MSICAAAGKLAGAFHHVAAAVAAREQARLERFGAVALACGERKGGVFRNLRRQRALQRPETVHTATAAPALSASSARSRRCSSCREATSISRSAKIAPGEPHNALAEQRLQIRGERPGVRLIGTKHKDRPTGLAADIAADERASRHPIGSKRAGK